MVWIEQIDLSNTTKKAKIIAFLNKFNLRYTNVDCTFVAWKENQIIGVCSKIKNLIKNIAVCEEHKEDNIFSKLISEIRAVIYKQNFDNVFVITKKKNKIYFESLNFEKIYENDEISFLAENDKGYKKYKQYINAIKFKKNVGLILLNANPLTLGHLNLINESRKENDQTFLIPVIDDSSFFTTKERLEIIKKNIINMSDTFLIEGTEFLISKSIFPSYFLSSDEATVKQEAEMNAWLFNDIFKSKISNSRITRYLGTEPYSQTTNEYNKSIEKISEQKIKIKIINRFKDVNDEVISASKVRAAIYEKDLSTIKSMVSQETFSYINNEKFFKRATTHKELVFKNN